jgi:uncharacterized protein DUF2442
MKRSSDRSMDELPESPKPINGPNAVNARVSRRRLIVDVDDGRTIVVPLSHFTGFADLPPRAFKNLELMGSGYGIYFPAIDEHISVELLFVSPSELRYSRIPAKLPDRRPRPVNTPAR